MAKIRFENGTVVNFEGDPTPQDVEEVASSMNISAPAPAQKEPSFLGKAARFVGGIARDITKPLVTSLARPIQLEESLRTGTTPTFNIPFYGKIEPPKGGLAGVKQSFGTGLKTVSLGLGPVSGGASFFGGQALEDDRSIPAVAGYAAGGAAFGVGSKAIGKAVEKIPSTAWGAILKRVPTQALKNPQLEKQIAEQGVVGISKRSISRKMGKQIQDIELQISDALESKSGRVETSKIVGKLTQLKNAYANIPGEESSIDVINAVADATLSRGRTVSVQVANEIKRDIYSLISKTYGKGLLEVPAKRESQKLIARGLKEEIESIVPEIKRLNARQAVFIQAKQAIDKTIARETGKGIGGVGIGLYDILATLGGISAGAVTGKSPILAGAAALAVTETAKAPAILSGASAAATKLVNYFNRLSPTQKLLFYNGLRGLIGEGTQKDQLQE